MTKVIYMQCYRYQNLNLHKQPDLLYLQRLLTQSNYASFLNREFEVPNIHCSTKMFKFII